MKPCMQASENGLNERSLCRQYYLGHLSHSVKVPHRSLSSQRWQLTRAADEQRLAETQHSGQEDPQATVHGAL